MIIRLGHLNSNALKSDDLVTVNKSYGRDSEQSFQVNDNVKQAYAQHIKELEWRQAQWETM